MKIISLKIIGMSCGGCSASVEKLVDELKGISERNIDHQTDSGIIKFDENIINKEDIIKKINESHYKVEGFEDVVNENKQEIPPCPVCHQSGNFVPNTVFKSNLRKEDYSKINFEKKNYICLNPNCSIAYYNDEITLDQSVLKRELWYKKGVKRKVICYCNNIDEEQIKKAVVDHGLNVWEDIMSLYRNKINERCEILNPTGNCCRDLVAEVVSKTKRS